jgi:hypothetical protein
MDFLKVFEILYNISMNRTDIINSLIKKNNYKSYLEIGLDNPDNNYNCIQCENKECVDPFFEEDHICYDVDISCFENIINNILTYRMTSDDFFSNNNKKYDIIFIDGLHTKEQVGRDIINGLKVLNNGGKIVCHDCLPTDENSQIVPRQQAYWFGDVWRTIPELSKQNIKFNTIDCDCGCCIIDYFENYKDLHYITQWDKVWENFESDNSFMNIISTEDFIKNYLD